MHHPGPAFCALATFALGHSTASFVAAQAVTTPAGDQKLEATLTKEVLTDGVYLFRAPAAG